MHQILHRRIALFRLLLLAGICLALSAGYVLRKLPTPDDPTSWAPSPGPIDITFSRPQYFRGNYTNGPEAALAQSIANASCCVDLAVYDINLQDIARALVRAVNRGVKVRVVTDSDNERGEAMDMLRGAGIPVIGDQRTALMHDKFIVIDRSELWAGSMNLTTDDAYLDDNNFLRIRSGELSAPFLAEFEEMFTSHKFGGGSPGESGGPVSLGTGCSVQPLFAPDDAPAGEIIRLLRAARRNIHMLAFSFTSQDMANALRASASRGVEVRGVVERSQAESNTGAQYQPMRKAGLDFRLDGNSHNMHHKVIIIDGEIVITGSYNFTASAEHSNDEDVLILECSSAAAVFETEFLRIYSSGTI